MNEDNIISFTFPDTPLAKRYWAHTMVEGARQYTEKTTAIGADFGLHASAVVRAAAATITFPCKCGTTLVNKIKSRSDLSNLMTWRLPICKDCKRKAEAEEEARHEQYLAQKAVEEAERNAKREAKRDARKPKMIAQYGQRLMNECPECHLGFMTLKLNNKNFEIFKGCSSYPQCKHIEPVEAESIGTAREYFLEELRRVWSINNQIDSGTF
jgi:ssDNA-binding Zn-finger/Zn-ribbon topoisomerase 1